MVICNRRGKERRVWICYLTQIGIWLVKQIYNIKTLGDYYDYQSHGFRKPKFMGINHPIIVWQKKFGGKQLIFFRSVPTHVNFLDSNSRNTSKIIVGSNVLFVFS